MNLNFVIVYVRDMEKARAFYTDVVGFSVVKEISSPTFITLRSASGAMIGLQDNAAAVMAPRAETHAGNIEISFEDEDVDGTWKRWKDQGVEMLTDAIDLPFGRYFMAKDPEGHYLSVYRFARRTAPVPDAASQTA